MLFILKSIRSGSTCCISILTSDFENPDVFSGLDIAWCGDTRFCLVRNGKIVYLTEEHKPENESEKNRIIRSGGTVSFVSNAWRVNDSLAVSRSFGKSLVFNIYIQFKSELSCIEWYRTYFCSDLQCSVQSQVPYNLVLNCTIIWSTWKLNVSHVRRHGLSAKRDSRSRGETL